MKKFGFTLAEVLITLGVLGIVAAVTMPGLVAGSHNAAYVSKIISTTESLENAFTRAIQEEQVDNIFETSMWKVFSNNLSGSQLPSESNIKLFTSDLKTYLNVSQGLHKSMKAYYTDKGKDIYYMDSESGTKGKKISNNNAVTYAYPVELKNGGVIFIQLFGSNCQTNKTFTSNVVKKRITEYGGAIFGKAAHIYIDVNSISEPNILGKDIFSFIVDQDGILHPEGSSDYSICNLYTKTTRGEALKQVWTNGVDTNTASCINGIFGTSSEAGGGCTARVLQTGKMDY